MPLTRGRYWLHRAFEEGCKLGCHPLSSFLYPRQSTIQRRCRCLFPAPRTSRIVECALELDNYNVQSCARAQDYIMIFMRCNALLNGRTKVTMSDLYLYDLVRPLFLGSMGELGTENLVLSLFKKHPV